jgi:DNA polymerase-3 subunit alpha
MKKDKYGQLIFDTSDVFEFLYQGKLSELNNIQVEKNQETSNLPLNFYVNHDISIEDFDSIKQKKWFMPENYKNLDIEHEIITLCPPWDPNHTRVEEELTEFRQRNMLDLLRWLKYFVDTARSNNIVWGVGRGSSVSSYVLFLIGVHKIDPIKYNLDWREFLR